MDMKRNWSGGTWTKEAKANDADRKRKRERKREREKRKREEERESARMMIFDSEREIFQNC